MKTTQAPARQGADRRQPQVDAGADGEDREGGRPDRLHHRVAQAGDGLRADLQPGHGLRHLVVFVPPAVLLLPAGLRVRGAGLAFATGVVVGAAIWGNCNWGGNEININRTNYNNFNKTNIQNNNFQHNAEHRKGVSYKDGATAQKYNKGGDKAAAQSREQFRGHAEQGRPQMQGMDKSQLQSQVGAADPSRGRGDRTGGGRSRAGRARARATPDPAVVAVARAPRRGRPARRRRVLRRRLAAPRRAPPARAGATSRGGGGGGRGGGGRR